MRVDTVPLPSMLRDGELKGRTVVVIDALRATTTIATALFRGATEVRAFETPAQAVEGAGRFDGPKLLAGERACVRIDGFDLGNSPREMTAERVVGRTIFLSTTNGTRAILAAVRGGSARVMCGALVNCGATADLLRSDGRDVTMLCAGTDGHRTTEDLLVADMIGLAIVEGAAVMPPAAVQQRFRESRGGRNLMAAGLGDDVEVCAELDACPITCGVVEAETGDGGWACIRRMGA